MTMFQIGWLQEAVESKWQASRLQELFRTLGYQIAYFTVDALHIAAAVSSGLDYLLTWNFKHLANAAILVRVEAVCRNLGYEPCIICTPEELLED